MDGPTAQGWRTASVRRTGTSTFGPLRRRRFAALSPFRGRVGVGDPLLPRVWEKSGPRLPGRFPPSPAGGRSGGAGWRPSCPPPVVSPLSQALRSPPSVAAILAAPVRDGPSATGPTPCQGGGVLRGVRHVCDDGKGPVWVPQSM